MSIIQDGANSRYHESNIKVLHLLKQPTEPNASMAGLVDDIVRDNNLGQKFMYRLAVRSYALQNNFLPFSESSDVNKLKKSLGVALQQSAIVNLENSDCSSSTSQDDVATFASQNKERWHKVILDLEPHFVVCGGTFGAVWKALGDPKWSTLDTGMDYFYDPENSNIVYLDMCHPSARYPLGMVHTYLVESAKLIHKAKN